jgi:hypothetical protein
VLTYPAPTRPTLTSWLRSKVRVLFNAEGYCSEDWSGKHAPQSPEIRAEPLFSISAYPMDLHLVRGAGPAHRPPGDEQDADVASGLPGGRAHRGHARLVIRLPAVGDVASKNMGSAGDQSVGAETAVESPPDKPSSSAARVCGHGSSHSLGELRGS